MKANPLRLTTLGMVLSAICVGCGGPSVGESYKFADRDVRIYFDRADLDKGGPASQFLRDAVSGRIAIANQGVDRVRVLETSGDAVKLRLETGEQRGATGWMKRENWSAAGATAALVGPQTSP